MLLIEFVSIHKASVNESWMDSVRFISSHSHILTAWEIQMLMVLHNIQLEFLFTSLDIFLTSKNEVMLKFLLALPRPDWIPSASKSLIFASMICFCLGLEDCLLNFELWNSHVLKTLIDLRRVTKCFLRRSLYLIWLKYTRLLLLSPLEASLSVITHVVRNAWS